jgi:hypothetical protein
MEVKEAKRILNIRTNTYSLDELNAKFKTMALQVHPDRGGSEILFSLVSKAYKCLKVEYNNRISNRNHNDLRESSKNYIREQVRKRRVNMDLYDANKARLEEKENIGNGLNSNLIGSNFTDTFNRVFDHYKRPSAFDKGYGDIMSKSSNIREDINIEKSVKNMRNFNKNFEEQPINRDNMKIIKYKEPKALPTSYDTLKYSNLVEDEVEDFSDNINGLNAIDYRKAHTTSRLIDARLLKSRKDYKNVDELDIDRKNISYIMSEEDIRKYKLKELRERKREELRLNKLRKNDQEIGRIDSEINKYMIRYKN